MKTDDQGTKKKFNIWKYLYDKLMLLVALGCEVVAYLMTKGLLEGSARVINGLTVAGVVILFIYLVMNGLKQKYRQYSKKWGVGPYADDSASDPAADSCEDSEPKE